MPESIHIKPEGSHDTGRCECCGNTSRKIWGLAWRDDEPYAYYLVHWTHNHVQDFGANFDLIIGKWGVASSSDRYAVSLEYRVVENGPAIMVIDSSDREIANSNLVGTALNRDDIIGSPFAQDVFDLYDVIMAQDDRLKEILCGWVVGV